MSDVPSYGAWLPPAAEPPDGRPRRGDDAPDKRDDAQRWRPWSAPAALLAALAATFLGSAVITLVAAILGADLEDPPPAVTIVGTYVQDAAFVGAALLFALSAGPLRPAQFGIARVPLGRALRWTALAYVGYWLAAGAWAQLIGIDEPDSLPSSLGVDESVVAAIAVCVLVTVAAPIAEEILFRGYFFGAVRNWRGPWPAALITGAVFGAIHVFGQEAEFLVPLAILGVALCVIRWKTGSLLPCIALHAANNAVAFAVAESWTVWQGALLAVGAPAVCLLLVRPVLGPRPAVS